MCEVSVRYGDREAVHGVNWEVGGASLVTALLGPSGCGKSTMLRAVAGLEPIASGTVAYDGHDLARVPVHRRDFGVVFQDGQLFPGRTVGQNIAYGLARRGMSRKKIGERVEELLQLVQLPGMAQRRVEELSGGQAQRVALARALAPRPRLLLLDEPLAALDRRLRDDLAVAISDIVRAAGTPTVVVTHDHGEAAVMADVVSVMREGRIVDTASPQRLWRRPGDEWVARFLGATRILEATAESGTLRTPIGDVAVGGVEGFADLPDGPCSVGLRPDAVRATADPDGQAVATRSVPMVGQWRIHAAVDRGPGAGIELDAVADRATEAGARIRLTPAAERIAVIGG